MKKALLSFILFIIFNACSSIKESPGGIYFYGYDFSEYAERNFLITPYEYTGKFQSIGMITAECQPKISKNRLVDESGKEIDQIFQRVESTTYFIELIDDQKVINEFYLKAVEMGADAIANFKIELLTREEYGLIIPYTKIYGFAIKRN